MKHLTFILLCVLIIQSLQAQHSLEFDTNDVTPLFYKRVQIKNFYPSKKNIDTTLMNADLQRISEQYQLSDSVLIKEIFYELHIRPICHKIVDHISPDFWEKEKKITDDFTDMIPWSGRTFSHVANLNLRTGTLTRQRYDVDIAMVLLDERTGKHYYYLAKCADTPLPFISNNP